MEIEKIIREFLHTMDFELCEIEENSITIQDLRNKDGFSEVLQLPVNFVSRDRLRVLESSKLKKDYYISVLNTKYPAVPFSKNGIDGIDLSIRRNEEKNEEVFMSQLFHDNDLYLTFWGKELNESYISYVTVRNNRPSMTYSVKEEKRKLEFSSFLTASRKDRKIVLSENEQNHTMLVVKENKQEIYQQEITKEEITSYLQSLAYHIKPIIEKANNGLQRLNPNLYEMMISYYPVANEFLQLLQMSTGSNEIIDHLIKSYFQETYQSEKGHTKIIEPKAKK